MSDNTTTSNPWMDPTFLTAVGLADADPENIHDFIIAMQYEAEDRVGTPADAASERGAAG